MAVQIQLRNDVAANWTSANPVLAVGELGLESDTGSYKIGDGVNPWNNLQYGGVDGASAYDIAVSNGFVGDEAAWLASLEGAAGADGVGVPAGGNAGQVLSKVDGQDYNTQWTDVSSASGERLTHGVFNATAGPIDIPAYSLTIWTDGAGNGAQSGVREFPTDGSGWGVQPEQIAGIALNTIPAQQGGEIVIAGSLDVDGSPYSQTGYVYVDPNNGTLTQNQTGGAAWNKPIGWITLGQQGAKLIFRPWAMSRQMGSLTDVNLQNPQGGQTLVYNNQTGYWENGSGGGGGTSIGDNLFLNGGFDIWQKLAYNQNSVTFGGVEKIADMWTFYQEGGSGDRTISRENLGIELGDNTVSNYFIKYTASNDVVGNIKLQQKIENVRTAASKNVVISFWAKSNVTVNVSGQFRQFFGSGSGSGDNYSGTSNGDQLQAGAGWKFVQLNATIPNVQGKDIRSDSYLAPEIVFQSPGDNAVIDVAQIKMEIGDSATDFRIKCDSIDEELRACQRYFYRIKGENSTPMVGPGYVESEVNFTFRYLVTMPTQMRSVPSFSSNQTWAYLHIGGGQYTQGGGSTTVRSSYSTPYLVTLEYIRGNSFTVSQENGLARLVDVNHYMDFSADLP